MAKTTIRWADYTWNPWQGCTKVSAGCRHCYMYRDKARYGQRPDVVARSKDGTFFMPLAKDRRGQWKVPPGALVFTCSWSDFFHAAADPWRREAWEIMRARRDVHFLVLTKRAENIAARLPADWGEGWPNVWLGVSAENRKYLYARAPELFKVASQHYFLSLEPQLEDVSVAPWLRSRLAGFDWVFSGGESGEESSHAWDPAWGLRTIRECQAAGVPVLIKQLGTVTARALGVRAPGANVEEFPEGLRVQEFPAVFARS